MGRKRAARQASSVYPSTPGGDRDTRASSIFPYSVARPPTDFAPPAMPVPDSVRTTLSPQRLSPPAIRVDRQDPFRVDPEEEDDEQILDHRQTPLYARSDWDATTGTKSAWSRSSYPDFADEIGTTGDGLTEMGDGPKTVWSRSSYASDRGLSPPPPLPAAAAERQVNEVRDPYIHDPGTAWSQESYRARASQVGVAVPQRPPTTLPPTHSIPLAGAAGKKSRQSVSNTQYGSALKSAGSRKPSELVVIAEMSEDSHASPDAVRPMTTGSVVLLRGGGGGDGAENPFSPRFAATPTTLARRPATAGKVGGHHHRSTLPSILDLEQLAARPKVAARPHSAGPPSMADSLEAPRFGRIGADSPRLLTPEAQNKLGRMSVATARYSLPPSREGARTRSNPSRISDPNSTASKYSAIHSLKATASGWRRFKEMNAVKWYRTWRPFITAVHALMAALLLTIAMADQNSGMGWLIKVQQGGLATMPAVGGFGLGVSGWCQLEEDEVCSGYTKEDFASTDGSFVVPRNGTLDLLYPLWTALTTMLWFQALFALSAGFLHFYLFFILSIPFSHLVDRTPAARPNSQDTAKDEEAAEEDKVQKEVDIRARCERPPFEEYIWVWWAWWGFRRGPIGHGYAFVVGALAVISGGLGVKFRSEASTAAFDGSVSFGFGGFVPFIVLTMTLDSFIEAIHYFCISPRQSFDIFLNPPDPTPAAILLPPSEKPLALRHRGTRASTFFAAPTTARLSRGQTMLHPGAGGDGHQAVPPLPTLELDEETRRWLIQYPQDPELVPLIASLRQGAHNDDFVLSDVGLLYLRPDEGDPSATALLVPPNGVIRREILDDSHVSEAGGHRGYDGMLDELERVFWWVGMEDDIDRYIGRCAMCQQNAGGGVVAEEKNEMDESKSTYTGITGMTGEEGETNMAVDMAVAMRKAKEEAERPWAGG